MALVAQIEPVFLEDLSSWSYPLVPCDGLVRTYTIQVSAGPNPPEKLPKIVRSPAWASSCEIGLSGSAGATGTILAGLADGSVSGLFTLPDAEGVPIPGIYVVGPGLLSKNASESTIKIHGCAGRDVIFAWDGVVEENDRVYVGIRWLP